MKRQYVCRVALCCLSLSACGGGGGGGGVASTPAPTPAQTNASLASLQFSEDFSGNAALIRYSLSRSTGGASQRFPEENTAARVHYDASARTYTLIGTSLAEVAFGPSDRDAGSSNNTITIYTKTTDLRQRTLALFNPGSANPELALTYASYGGLQVITDNGSNLDVNTAFFTFGVKTAASDMPRTGSASYSTKIDGQFADGTGAYIVGGSSSFSADFAAGTINFTMDPVGQNVVTGLPKSLGSHSINGSITSGNEFGGQTSSVGTYNSSLRGYFYGPAAAEIGGTFTISGGGGAGAGALVGKKD